MLVAAVNMTSQQLSSQLFWLATIGKVGLGGTF